MKVLVAEDLPQILLGLLHSDSVDKDPRNPRNRSNFPILLLSVFGQQLLASIAQRTVHQSRSIVFVVDATISSFVDVLFPLDADDRRHMHFRIGELVDHAGLKLVEFAFSLSVVAITFVIAPLVTGTLALQSERMVDDVDRHYILVVVPGRTQVPGQEPCSIRASPLAEDLDSHRVF